MIYLTNALPGLILATAESVVFTEMTHAEASKYLHTHSWKSAVGHADTARLFESLTCATVPVARITISEEFLQDSDNYLLAGLYSGPRLPEGATTLPEGATVRWFLVEKY